MVHASEWISQLQSVLTPQRLENIWVDLISRHALEDVSVGVVEVAIVVADLVGVAMEEVDMVIDDRDLDPDLDHHSTEIVIRKNTFYPVTF